MMTNNGRITIKEIAATLNVNEKTIKRDIATLKAAGVISPQRLRQDRQVGRLKRLIDR